MYGPVGVEVLVNDWQHDALREANEHRRAHTDTDYLNAMQKAHQHSQVIRLVAAAATVLVAMAVIVLI
jgi:hypothetical protein